MLNNYYILRAQTEYLKKLLLNKSIEDSLILEKNLFAFILKSENTQYLKFVLEKNLETFFIEDYQPLPRKNVLSAFPSIKGKFIIDVEILQFNRIILIKLSDEYTVVFYAIPNRSNLFIIYNNEIIDCYRDKAKFTGKSFDSLIQKQKEKSSEEINTIKEFLNVNYPHLGKYYRDELTKRLKTEGKGIDENISLYIEDFITSISSSSKFILYSKEKVLLPSLVELKDCESYGKTEFSDINTMIINYYRKYKYLFEKYDAKDNLISSIDSNIRRVEGKIKNLSITIEEAGNSEIYKMYGDILLSNIYSIDKSKSYFEFTDGKNLTHKIKLNPSLSIPENANHYYDKYKGLKNSVESLKKKLLLLERQREDLIKQKSEIENEENLKTIRKMNKSEANKSDTEKLPFRIFKLSDKFEVWVGKDSASNDLLTMKHTNQYDLWFHVRGSSGSHTILKFLDKNLTPEKELIIKAASIAAYYSKARNGKHIPVAYCEKKYVKKRKGFKQGAVVMEKEKIVFVDPKIPEI